MAIQDSCQALTDEIVAFRDERNWSQFHTLKNLLVSLNLETSELLEFAQWRDDKSLNEYLKNKKNLEAFADECGDILIYLLLICSECGIDLVDAAHIKLGKNRQKYPVEKSFGSSKKYTEL